MVGDVGVKNFIEALADRTWGGNSVARNFANAYQIAVCGRNKDFVSGVQIFGPKRLLHDRNGGFWRNFHEDAASDAFEAAGAERRRENFPILHRKDICGSAFGNFAALVEHGDFVESLLNSFANGPNIVQPGNALYAGHRRRRMASLFANREAHDVSMFREH